MTPLVAIMVAVLGGGFLTAYVNLRKAPAERESLNLANLQEVNEGYKGLVAELRLELARKDHEIDELRRADADSKRQIRQLLERVQLLEAAGG